MRFAPLQVGETNSRLGGVEAGQKTLQDKLDETQNQLSYTSKGIHLLCRFGSSSVNLTEELVLLRNGPRERVQGTPPRASISSAGFEPHP